MQSNHEPAKSDQQLTLSLKDVCCVCCDSEIRDAATSIQGVTNVDIDYAKNAVTVNYNPNIASPEKIRVCESNLTQYLGSKITGKIIHTVEDENDIAYRPY